MKKKKELSKKAMDLLQKRFGPEAVTRLSGAPITNVKFTSSGSMLLDIALGGGFADGRIIEIYGPESAGKTTTTLHALAKQQEDGKVCGFIDAEHAFDTEYAKELGVDVDNLIVSQPESAEDALDLLIAMLETEEFGAIVIDSTNALTPRAELDGEMADHVVGVAARLMSKGLRKAKGLANKSNCTLFFISQLREKIGVMYGNPEAVGVGNALKFYASQRLDIRRSTPIEEDGIAIGHTMKMKTVKNKVAPPFKRCEVPLRYGYGYDVLAEMLDLSVQFGIVNKAGSWFNYGDTKLGQGKKSALSILGDSPELFEEIKYKTINEYNRGVEGQE